ncbi:MAG: hypothetical protein ACE5EC_03570 [Phycisphaerae bacterium]
MIRSLMLVVCCVVLMGTSCSGPQLTCGNPLDGTDFGFTLSVPEAFTCASNSGFAFVFGDIRTNYSQDSMGIGVSVVVSDSQTSGNNEDLANGTQIDDLGMATNTHGLTFDLQKITIDLAKFFDNPALGMRVSYAGGTTLPSGQNLIISVSADSDIASMRDTLDAIVATVAPVSTP